MIVEPDSADLPADPAEPVQPGPLVRAAYVLGSVGLLSATATDALAVAGRHLGFRLLGSIEIVQSAVVLIATSAMIVATIVGAHASVHIFTERMSPVVAGRLARVAASLGALAFALLAIGSAWVASDLWNGFEQTELLGIGLRWLRALWIAAALLVCLLFLRRALRPGE